MEAERADARMDARWKRKGSKKSVLRAQGTEQSRCNYSRLIQDR